MGKQWLGVPSAAPSLALGITGNLNGVYHYAVTFCVLRQGTLTVLGESLPCPTSGAISPANQQVNLTSIPVSTNSLCNGRSIYRTVASGSQLKFVATIPDNLTTNYSDNVADGNLGGNVPTMDSADQSIFGMQALLSRTFYAPPL